MSQHDYSIANQGFPATRADINNALSAIATNNSGTSAPSTQYAGQFWIDTTTSTWTMYIHDGADDIQFATIDTSTNTVNFIDSALASDVVINTSGAITTTGAFTSVGIDDNATSTAITIDSSQNVDIVGTTTSSNFITDGSGYAIKMYFNGTATLNNNSNAVIFTGAGASGDYLAGTLNLQSRGDGTARDINLITGATPSNTLTAHGNGDISFYEDTGTTPKMFWDASAESLGIGTASPNTKLQSTVGSNGSGAVNAIRLQNVGTTIGDGAKLLFTAGTSTDGAGIAGLGQAANSANLVFYAGGNTERMRIDSSGNVGIGTTSPSQKLDINGNCNINNGSHLYWNNGDIGITNSGANIVFKTFLTSSFTERMRITSNGFTKHSNTGVYDTYAAADDAHQFVSDNQTHSTLWVTNTNASYSDIVQKNETARTPNSAFSLLTTTTGNLTDDQHKLRGDGNAYCDGSWNGGGADYAEYFEWSDGNINNEDRVGYSVVLDGNKIRKATSEDNTSNIIGVVSGNPFVVGDDAWSKWHEKYLKDDFGRYILEEYTITEWQEEITENETTKTISKSFETDKIPSDEIIPENATVLTHEVNGDILKRRILNPNFDETSEYITREDRKEWDTVGLLGKVRIRKAQPVKDTWIKMRDISETVEEYLIK
jgi:hypothetical protein